MASIEALKAEIPATLTKLAWKVVTSNKAFSLLNSLLEESVSAIAPFPVCPTRIAFIQMPWPKVAPVDAKLLSITKRTRAGLAGELCRGELWGVEFDLAGICGYWWQNCYWLSERARRSYYLLCGQLSQYSPVRVIGSYPDFKYRSASANYENPTD